MARSLGLRRETLTELTASELADVAGAAVPTFAKCALPSLNGCFTGIWPTFDGCTGTA